MIAHNIDYLVLGCTHYPFLINQIKKIVPATVTIIDSGAAVARQTQKLLTQLDGLKSELGGKATFFTNSDSTVMRQLLGDNSNIHFKDF